ncbi:Hypothetical predicted protein [Octopus vulgaris]|uniref:Uncharacterized protein n=1 Tax=Octopus vulgaris TaxID=6645 RepID=A0AA36BSB8_OCTVU|nr:Hypothetical predicted protein [Octopus vulgaris]
MLVTAGNFSKIHGVIDMEEVKGVSLPVGNLSWSFDTVDIAHSRTMNLLSVFISFCVAKSVEEEEKEGRRKEKTEE